MSMIDSARQVLGGREPFKLAANVVRAFGRNCSCGTMRLCGLFNDLLNIDEASYGNFVRMETPAVEELLSAVDSRILKTKIVKNKQIILVQLCVAPCSYQ
jgi:hypothetical protein